MPLFGFRSQNHHYREMVKVAWENRDQLPFAWRILSNGVCDGCALGTSGLRDWTLPHTHLCMVRLELMRLNTAPALDSRVLEDLRPLQGRPSRELRALGRLPEPMLRRPGEAGFRVVSWDEALDRITREARETDPQRIALYLSSRGLTNEAYYAAQKAARFLGTNHVDNSARLCHAASTFAMRAMLGYGAATCSYADWLHADLIVFLGSNVANNQPVTIKYLHYAKKHGARIAVVNPYREPGLKRYWIPSIASSAVRGTAIADHWFDVHTGGDRAFLIGVLRALIERQGIDETFVRDHTIGFDQARMLAEAATWDAIERESGLTRQDIGTFAELLIAHPKTIFVWSMGLTQHAHGVETVRSLVNVALARGLPSRSSAGLVPIRGHSGVQGGAEVGCQPRVDAETRARWSAAWGFPVPETTGWTAAETVAHAADGAVDLFWIVGGNFLETIGDEITIAPRARATAAARPPRHRVHIVDARRGRGRRAAAAGHDALRVAGRRYRNVDRTTHHLLAGDSGTANRIRETGMVGLSRGHGPRPARSTTSRGSRGRCRDSARDRPRRAVVRRDRNAGVERRSNPVGRAAAVRRRSLCHAGWQSAVCRRIVACHSGGARGLHGLNPPRQAVQLDDPARDRSAERRGAPRHPDQR